MSKRKNPLHIRIRLLLILFCLTLLVNGCDNQTSTDRAKGLSEQTVIPYASLAMDTVDDPMILRFAGWDMGKQIHEKFGYQSHQEALIDYTKILGKRKESIERYLGKPSSHDDEGYTYRSNWGSITINYYKGICHDLTVDYVYDFKSGSSRILMEEKFHFTSPLDCHIQFPTVKEDPCSITFEASKPSGTRL